MSVMIESANGRVLLDCGPQTIYNLHRLGHKIVDVRSILISHLHGDHAGGLPFVLLDLLFRERNKRAIQIVGPSALDEFIRTSYHLFYGATDPAGVYEIVSEEKAFPFTVTSIPAKHTVPGVCYRLEVEGKTIVYTGDTSTGKDLVDFARGADYLIHEAAELDQERARQYGHSTPLQAAKTAAEAKVGKLILVHRPVLSNELVAEILKVFSETVFPQDLDVMEI